eukprot:1810285-Lingulodinium_polyedra.AAC.1
MSSSTRPTTASTRTSCSVLGARGFCWCTGIWTALSPTAAFVGATRMTSTSCSRTTSSDSRGAMRPRASARPAGPASLARPPATAVPSAELPGEPA